MCYERLRTLKCDHYESYQFDKCSSGMGRACKNYKQEILRKDKHRSCYKCKAEKMTTVGVASPSLGKSDIMVTTGKEIQESKVIKDSKVMEDNKAATEQICWEKHLF